MIEQLLPGSVATCEARDDHGDAPLYPEEEQAVARAVAKRRAEFRTARHCARRALERLGLPGSAVPAGPNREPRWPSGVVGSITHCDGYRAAAVARASDIAALGIDAEPHAPLPDGVLARVSVDEEREWLGRLGAAAPAVRWDRLLFSAKESVYKAWFPLAGRWLGFCDAAIDVDVEERAFSARLLVAGPVVGASEVTGFEGRWVVRDGLVLTAVHTLSGA